MSLKSDHPLFRLAAVKLPEIKIQEHDELKTFYWLHKSERLVQSLSIRLVDNNQWRASYGALGHVPPLLSTISFLFHFRVNLTANYPIIL